MFSRTALVFLCNMFLIEKKEIKGKEIEELKMVQEIQVDKKDIQSIQRLICVGLVITKNF